MGGNLKKKISRRSLVKKLDAIVSQYIRARDKKCVVCGSTEKLTNGHLFSRQAYSTRWDEVNCHCQCWGCNYRHEFDYYPYEQWFKNKYGEERYHELHRQFVTPRKFKDFQLLEMIEEYKEKLNILNQ
jgi:hypothetical protein